MNARLVSNFPLALVTTSGLAVSLTLCSCTVGPKYEPPQTVVPQSFSNLTADGFRASSTVNASRTPDAQWWMMLGDTTLNGLIERAISGNLDLRLASSRIREARAARGISESGLYPTMDLSGRAERSRQSENAFGGGGGGGGGGGTPSGRPSNLFQIGFDAGWELDVFGAVRRSVDAADADIQGAEERRRDTMVTLAAELARNYVELRGQQRRLEIARKNIQLQKDTLELTQSRFRAGLTSDLDVAQAESSVSAVEAEIPSLDQGIKQTMHRIAVLVGQQPSALVTELSTPTAIPLTPGELPVGLPSDLLRRRADVRAAERGIAAQTARVGVATADLFPRFSLSGSFGLSASKLPTVPDSSSRFWSFGPAVRWPILDWGRVRSTIRVEEARTEQALIGYEQAVLKSFEDVENALVAYGREQDRRESLRTALAANERAFKTANDLYTAGLTDFQRVLDTQRNLFSSEDSLTLSDQSVATNLIALYKALGGGWEVTLPENQQPEERKRPPASSVLSQGDRSE